MQAKDLRKKTFEELQQALQEGFKEQFSLRMQNATNQLGDISQLKRVRRNIARVKTIINEKRQDNVGN